MSDPMLANSPPNSKPRDRILHLEVTRYPGGLSTMTQVNLQADGTLLFTGMSVAKADGPHAMPVVLTVPELARILVKACLTLNRAPYLELAEAETRLQAEA